MLSSLPDGKKAAVATQLTKTTSDIRAIVQLYGPHDRRVCCRDFRYQVDDESADYSSAPLLWRISLAALGRTPISRIQDPVRRTGMANEGYHEPISELSDETRDMHRAITSLMEELEAVDWYNQRVNACKDEELKAILAHNRDEEKEHASMVLEWIRRKDPSFDKELKDYLFTDELIAHE